ncbi:GNAT family N-acetyltransferase [Papillibacter cinnamivorans]|uniref:Ribosomal protein S18 acetylase RimI n=1 Tax=Papillibacter cinnamivorans DSM 12816 TaxID=1122930 RepID=A0A1W2CAS1_9FIRM|nr:GNAT family N-acetyltransferase [Papillibacter cinnamivorans]SMC81962.1 Ribosomal protein S18 acetylase RimI [Papillibacter cinnamivorans DSM 12816]
MEIKSRNRPEDAQILQLRELEKSCRLRDGQTTPIPLNTWMNFNPGMKSCFLLYAGERLVSFLNVFAPEAREAEVYAVTHPEFRRRGYFAALLREAEAELKRCGVSRILLVCEKMSRDGQETARRLGGRLQHSEYRLKFEGAPETAPPGRLRLEEAGPGDLKAISALDVRIFGSDPEVSLSMLGKTLEDPKNRTFSVFLGEKRIGLCNAGLREDGISIFGLGIAPEHQGMGYGRDMLLLLLGKLREYPGRDITLEADSENQAALRLYRSSGFTEITRFDYYEYISRGSGKDGI